MRLYTYLIESKEIALSYKIYKTLSSEARSAIDQWEAMNWHTGPLEKSFANKTQLAQEIINAFEPIRELLKNKHGNKIKLYRGMKKSNKDHTSKRVLTSWTNDKQVAESFAGLRDTSLRPFIREPLTNQEIEEAVKKYKKRGFVTVRGYKYKQSKTDPEFYDIFDRSNNFVTDGNNLYRELKDKQKEDEFANSTYLENSIILEKKVDIDKIVWITNNLNSKEFIVSRYKVT